MRKTAMQNLKDDLLETIITGKEALNGIKDVNIKSACKTTLETTIQDIINRIDNELFEIEKEQIIKAYSSINGFENLLKEDAEKYYNENYTQSSE